MPPISRKQLLENRANRPNKFNLRRSEIAAATLAVLAENGYAKTSLRDIAAQADFSLGTLHYYFENKVELITYCVRTYKRQFVEETNELTDSATDLTSLVDGFIDHFIHAVEFDYKAHCLWYDTRSQSMFDPSFRAVVSEIENSLYDMVGKMLRRVEGFTQRAISVPDKRVYWLLDGMFQHYLRAVLDNSETLVDDFDSELRSFLKTLL